MSDAVMELAAEAGILPSYWDQTGQERHTSPETAVALLTAMELPAGSEAEARDTLDGIRAARDARVLPPFVVTEAGAAFRWGGAGDWTLATEQGEVLDGRAEGEIVLPPLGAGLHRLLFAGGETTLIAAPPSLPLPDRAWGVTLPLYGLRPPATGGLADYEDLADAVAGLAAEGADFVGINPVHAGFPASAREYSPYAPSHRRRLNWAHLRLPGDTAEPAPLVDYARDLPARRAAAEAAFATAGNDADFAAWAEREGEALALFATHQALSDRLGPFWRDWPEACRAPNSPAVAEYRRAHADRVRFHAWLQYQAERQLDAAARAARDGGMRFGLYLDLAVGTHPHGAETWADPHLFARGVSLGAPPDAFSADGQTWGLAPFSPRALAAEGFRPLAETLRRQFRFSKLLRIDHILGFERAYWVPEGGGPGAYVRMPRDAMLAVARIEAARAGATIVGEDLGNIPDGLQAALAASGILGCRVMMFEQHGDWVRQPQDYPEGVLASFGTHDLPTWAGWREGRDIAARRALGQMDDGRAADLLEGRRQGVAAMLRETGGASAADLHRFLGRSAARLVAVQIEDILGIEDQPNLPGTIHEYPNWRRRLPVAPRDFRDNPAIAETARILKESGR